MMERWSIMDNEDWWTIPKILLGYLQTTPCPPLHLFKCSPTCIEHGTFSSYDGIRIGITICLWHDSQCIWCIPNRLTTLVRVLLLDLKKAKWWHNFYALVFPCGFFMTLKKKLTSISPLYSGPPASKINFYLLKEWTLK